MLKWRPLQGAGRNSMQSLFRVCLHAQMFPCVQRRLSTTGVKESNSSGGGPPRFTPPPFPTLPPSSSSLSLSSSCSITHTPAAGRQLWKTLWSAVSVCENEKLFAFSFGERERESTRVRDGKRGYSSQWKRSACSIFSDISASADFSSGPNQSRKAEFIIPSMSCSVLSLNGNLMQFDNHNNNADDLKYI